MISNPMASPTATPEQNTGISRVGQDLVNGRPSPPLPGPSPETIPIQSLGDLLAPLVLEGHVKHPFDRLS